MPFCAWCGTEVAATSYVPCPSCGNPTNGAPRPQVVAQGNRPLIVAFAVAGLLGVIVVVGIIAAIAVPNLLTASQRSKQLRTVADIRSIGTAIEAYAVDNNRFPDPERLEQELVPKYMRALPQNDAWDRPFIYDCWSSTGGEGCDAYAVASRGRDGALDHDSPDQYSDGGATTDFDADIVMINGKLVQYPKGTTVN